MKGWLTSMNDYICSETDKDFVVLMDEWHWNFDNKGILSSVKCIYHDNEIVKPVTWDNEGAYIQHNNEKIYVLVHTC